MSEMTVVGGLSMTVKELAHGNKTAKPSFSAIKKMLKERNPDLSSAKLKTLAEQAMTDLTRRGNAMAVAAISDAYDQGYSFESMTEAELKSGKQKLSIVVAKPAPKAEKAKTKAELLKEMEELKAQLAAVSAKTIEG